MSVAASRVVERFDVVKDVAPGFRAVDVDLSTNPLALE